MAIRFRCPCGQKLKTHDGTEGRHVKCTKCRTVLRVPDDGFSTYETIASPAVAESPVALASSPPVAPAESTADDDASAESAKMRILIADSNPEDRQKIARILQDHNYIVLEAEDGPKALELIRQKRPAAALLNVRLDLISGFQVVEQLRSMSNVKNKDVWDTPVLMTAERLQGRDKQYSMSIGAHGYFVKPLQPAQICSKLERIAAKYHLH